jgi:Rps23 Pro-64 3,4-dihydroxylase Tpa1-like proline 4-hydroxylase
VTPEKPEWPLPPYVQLRDFLPSKEHHALLDWALANEASFRPAKIINEGEKSVIDPELRVALTTRNFGPFQSMLEQRLLNALPALAAGTGTKQDATSIELELAAHGDGGHYAAHLDLSYGKDRVALGAQPGEDRVLSAVYYFYREPKAFTGGELRLYRFGARPKTGPVAEADYVDLEPLQNSIAAFPSWTLHEVRPVHCPGDAFADHRFALNCWFCRKL